MNDELLPVNDFINNAKLVAWDECCNISLALDDAAAEWFRNSDDYQIVEGSVEDMIETISEWWDSSCRLRYVEGVRLDPEFSLVEIVEQFAGDDDDDDNFETE